MKEQATASPALATAVNHLFRLVPALYPELVRVLRSCDLTAPEFFTLSYIRHHGKPLHRDGRPCVPVARLSQLVVETKEIKAGGASDFVKRLMHKGHVIKQDVTDEQYKLTFEHDRPRGQWSKVVILQPSGEGQLGKVNGTVEKLLLRELNSFSRKWGIRPALTAFNHIAPKLIEHFEKRGPDSSE